MIVYIVLAIIAFFSLVGLSGFISGYRKRKRELYEEHMREVVDDDVIEAFYSYESWEQASINATNPQSVEEFEKVVEMWRPNESVK